MPQIHAKYAHRKGFTLFIHSACHPPAHQLASTKICFACGRLAYLQRIAAPHPDHHTPWKLALHCHIDAPPITHCLKLTLSLRTLSTRNGTSEPSFFMKTSNAFFGCGGATQGGATQLGWYIHVLALPDIRLPAWDCSFYRISHEMALSCFIS